MDFRALAEQAPMDALCLAFEYERAKCVRAAKNGATK